MEEILTLLENKHSWKDSLRKCCRMNRLNIELASAYTPLRFRAAYARFKAIYQRRNQDRAERWLQNELKAFQWFTVAVSDISEKNIKDFKQPQIDALSEVFYFKKTFTLDYEVRKLGEDPTQKITWDFDEEILLTKIVQELPDASNKWNEFARKLYEVSERKFFRTGKQCRERWLNHLDPSKKRGQWKVEEDLQLARLFIVEGKKWSQVSREMGGSRTQHMVKNRYKTLIARQRKQFPQIKSDSSLLKTLIFPEYAEKYKNKPAVLNGIRHIDEEVKYEHKQAIEPLVKEQICEKKEEKSEENYHNFDLDNIVKEEVEKHENKSVPQTSAFSPLAQAYSPWYMGYHHLTPTYSPFFVNVPTFSTFQASFNNQFYCPSDRQNERLDQL